jgi:hypothetical protein
MITFGERNDCKHARVRFTLQPFLYVIALSQFFWGAAVSQNNFNTSMHTHHIAAAMMNPQIVLLKDGSDQSQGTSLFYNNA